MLEVRAMGGALRFVEDHWETDHAPLAVFAEDRFRPRLHPDAPQPPDFPLFWANRLARLIGGEVVDTRPRGRVPAGAVL